MFKDLPTLANIVKISSSNIFFELLAEKKYCCSKIDQKEAT